MSDCIFCRIVRGDLPSTRIWEDDAVLAFMDIGPIIKGHTLVIPKQHLDPLTAVPPPLLGRLMEAVQRIMRAQIAGLRANGVNVHQTNGAAAGQVVPHVHFHVIPRFAHDGHSWNWRAGSYQGAAEMAEWADRIRGALPARES